MRAAVLLVLGCVATATADARESDAAPRFEARAVRVQVRAPQAAASRYDVVARLSPVIEDDGLAVTKRFRAHAAVKAATATCRVGGELPFADGFEG